MPRKRTATCRPPLPRELHNTERPFQNAVKVEDDHGIIVSENLAALEEGGWSAVGPYSTHSFTFDHVYDQQCDQKKVYETTAKAVVESSLKGYNATIFAVSCLPLAFCACAPSCQAELALTHRPFAFLPSNPRPPPCAVRPGS